MAVNRVVSKPQRSFRAGRYPCVPRARVMQAGRSRGCVRGRVIGVSHLFPSRNLSRLAGEGVHILSLFRHRVSSASGAPDASHGSQQSARRWPLAIIRGHRLTSEPRLFKHFQEARLRCQPSASADGEMVWPPHAERAVSTPKSTSTNTQSLVDVRRTVTRGRGALRMPKFCWSPGGQRTRGPVLPPLSGPFQLTACGRAAGTGLGGARSPRCSKAAPRLPRRRASYSALLSP